MAIKLLFSKRTIPGWLVWLIIVTLNIVRYWGDVEFVKSKTSTIQNYSVIIWDFVTDGFWGPLIVLLLGLVTLWMGIRKGLGVMAGYQGKTTKESIRISDGAILIKTKSGPPPSCEFNTNNKQNRKMECDIAIQSVRFIEPIEKVIRPEYLPAFVSCEPSRLKRLRNSILGIHSPRIVIKKFTEKGIIFDEENTNGTNVIIEFYGWVKMESTL